MLLNEIKMYMFGYHNRRRKPQEKFVIGAECAAGA